MHVISFACLCESTRGTTSPLHSALFPDLFISSGEPQLSLPLSSGREREPYTRKRGENGGLISIWEVQASFTSLIYVIYDQHPVLIVIMETRTSQPSTPPYCRRSRSDGGTSPVRPKSTAARQLEEDDLSGRREDHGDGQKLTRWHKQFCFR